MRRKLILAIFCASLSGCVLYDSEVEKMTETHRKAIAEARSEQVAPPADAESGEPK